MNLEEATLNALKEEDSRGESIDKKVEINGIKRTLYWEAEEKCFDGIMSKIKELENYVSNWNIDFLGGRKNAYVEFKAGDGEGEFKMDFNEEGNIKFLQTTYSNQKVTYDFIKLAQALYNLWN